MYSFFIVIYIDVTIQQQLMESQFYMSKNVDLKGGKFAFIWKQM